MENTLENESKQNTPQSVHPQASPEQKNTSPKSKVEQAKEYLNTFHPGWDTYLKMKFHSISPL